MKKLLMAAASVAVISLTQQVSAAEDYVARVNNEKFTKADFDALLGSLTPEQSKQLEESGKKDEAVAQFIEAWVMEEVVKQAALNSGVDKKPEVKKMIDDARNQVIVRAFIAEQVTPKLTDAALEKEYNELKTQFEERLKGKSEYKIRHIFVRDQEKANQALKRLNAGEDFLKVAREMSEDQQTAQEGGDLGYVIEGASPEFDKALQSLKPGAYTKEAIKTENGYHIIKLDDKRKAKVPPFKDVKSSLQQRLAAKVTQDLVKKLRDKANVEVNLPAKN